MTTLDEVVWMKLNGELLLYYWDVLLRGSSYLYLYVCHHLVIDKHGILFFFIKETKESI